MKLLAKLLDRIRSGDASEEEIVQADRRAFMFGMAATAGGLLVAKPTRIFMPGEPAILNDSGGLVTANIIQDGEWIYDLDTKEIRHAGGKDTRTVQELYRSLREHWDAPEMMVHPEAVVGITPNTIRMVDGWQLTESAAKALRDGSVGYTRPDGQEEAFHHIRKWGVL